ncbi:hypothetical protein GCM10025880_19880 [Methylorubrum aminovorans]|nr:hypothetical protein GCM10025880_19880 [Methylorubrum aminovorans]
MEMGLHRREDARRHAAAQHRAQDLGSAPVAAPLRYVDGPFAARVQEHPPGTQADQRLKNAGGAFPCAA